LGFGLIGLRIIMLGVKLSLKEAAECAILGFCHAFDPQTLNPEP
jgi:hypothetical protein